MDNDIVLDLGAATADPAFAFRKVIRTEGE